MKHHLTPSAEPSLLTVADWREQKIIKHKIPFVSEIIQWSE